MEDAERAPSSGLGDSLGPQEHSRLLGRFGRRFAGGESIFREGGPAPEVYLLQEGRVRLFKRMGMSDHPLALIKPGDLFGEAALLDLAYGSTAIAVTDGVLLALDPGTLRGLLERYPRIAAQVLDQVVRRLREAEDQLEVMMLRSPQSKVTNALLKLAGRAVGAAAIDVSPVELSTRVGLDVEAVKRAVARLRERQYIRINGERIEIPDVEALRRLYVLLGTKDELAGTD